MSRAARMQPAAAAGSKPPVLVAIYHNADYYPPTANAATLLDRYFSVRLICREIDAPFRRWPAAVTVERVGAPGSMAEKSARSALTKLIEYRGFVAAIARAIGRERPRLIYAYEPHAFAASIWAGAVRRGIPVVYHLHELHDRGAPASLQELVMRYARRRTRLAAAVVFPEPHRAVRYLAEAGDPRPALVAPNCPLRGFVEQMPPWDELIARRWARPELLYMGALGADNGILEAIRALALLGPGLRLHLIGRADSRFRSELERLAQTLGVAARVCAAGWIPHAQLPARAVAATVGLSLHKAVNRNLEFAAGATNKIFEYAACALPVVVPDRPGYRELLADQPWAIFADPESAGAIADAIASTLSDRRRYTAMGLAARHAFERRFHYERAFAPVLERVIELAGARR